MKNFGLVNSALVVLLALPWYVVLYPLAMALIAAGLVVQTVVVRCAR